MSPKLIVFCSLLAVVYTTQLHRGYVVPIFDEQLGKVQAMLDGRIPKLLSLEEIFRHNDSHFSSDAIRSDADAGLRAVSVQPYEKLHRGYVIPVFDTRVNETQEAESPWVVSLQWRWQNKSSHFCSGAIVNCSWIVTAGECALSVPSYGDFIVKAGKHDLYILEPFEQTARVEKIFVHDKYNGNGGTYDIALLKLDTCLSLNTYVQAINLGTAFPIRDYTLYGWNTISRISSSTIQNKLQKAVLPVIPGSVCGDFIKKVGGEVGAHFCTSNVGPINATYIADHGSPFINLDKPELLGVVSWTILPYGSSEATIYTYIPDTDITTWITNTINNNSIL